MKDNATPGGQVTIKVSGNFRTDYGEALRDGCMGGLGITVSSIWSIYAHLKRGKLVKVHQHKADSCML